MTARFALIALALLTAVTFAHAADESKSAETNQKLKALIVDGQNNHNWKETTPVLRAALESSGRFTVDVATTPQDGKLDSFKPDFSKYDVIVSNYNGAAWPEATRKALEDYVSSGHGFVSVHAADNSFPDWPEYNKLIAVGGWGGRNEKSGPMLRWKDDKLVKDDTSKGGGGTHGKYFEWPVETRDAEHPIMKGLPAKWMHTSDELYATLRGPAENVKVLATAVSDVTHENEPILMTIDYGKGRSFHTTMGHDVNSMKCIGFVTTFTRGAEWAATGKVTIEKPADFPGAEKSVKWNPPAAK